METTIIYWGLYWGSVRVILFMVVLLHHVGPLEDCNLSLNPKPGGTEGRAAFVGKATDFRP